MNNLRFNTHPFLTFTSLSFDGPLFFPMLSNVVAERWAFMFFHLLFGFDDGNSCYFAFSPPLVPLLTSSTDVGHV